MSLFEELFIKLISLEGGYSNHAADKGGETKYGISKRSFPNEDIVNLTTERAKRLYLENYWVPAHIDLIVNNDLAWSLFKAVVHSGVASTCVLFQKACNRAGASLKTDGVIGNLTASFANANSNAVLMAFKILMCEKHVDICLKNRSQNVFLLGWLNRVLFK